jgi:hypothetical protein
MFVRVSVLITDLAEGKRIIKRAGLGCKEGALLSWC